MLILPQYPHRYIRFVSSIKSFFYYYSDLLLLCYWSIFLLSFELLGGTTSCQNILARAVSRLGSEGGEAKGQSPRLHYFPSHNAISSELVYQHSVTSHRCTPQTFLARHICGSGPTLLHCYSSRHNTSTNDINDRRIVIPISSLVGVFCPSQHLASLAEEQVCFFYDFTIQYMIYLHTYVKLRQHTYQSPYFDLLDIIIKKFPPRSLLQ